MEGVVKIILCLTYGIFLEFTLTVLPSPGGLMQSSELRVLDFEWASVCAQEETKCSRT